MKTEQAEKYSSVNFNRLKSRIGVLTGGGDVPGLNSVICTVVNRAEKEGSQVIGIKRGWSGIAEINQEPDADNSNNFRILDTSDSKVREDLRKAPRDGGTFLHSSRTNPGKMSKKDIPDHLRALYPSDNPQDLTTEVIKNLDWLGIDHLIAIGGDDTLSYAVRLAKEGVNVIGIPKTMDGDVPGTEYCIGFNTCINRTVEEIDKLRTSAASHEKIMVIEVFGRDAGFTALAPTLAGAADRCVIPEYPFHPERLTELLCYDRNRNGSKYALVLVSEGAKFIGGDIVYKNTATDAYGHSKLGGIGAMVAAKLEELSPQFNNGKEIETMYQWLGYLVRSGDPTAYDRMAANAFGEVAIDLILSKTYGMLVGVMKGNYGYTPIEVVTSGKKIVNVERDYDTEQLRHSSGSFIGRPMSIL